MRKSIRAISAIVILFVSAFIYYGCGCACGTVDETDVPASVLKNADDVIIAKTGHDFFEKYITIDLRRTKYLPPDYFLVYRLIMPEKPYVNETIEFTVDANGKLNESFPVKGLPDCANGGCDFSIDEAKAIEIAKENGLDKGIKDWQTIFSWNEKNNTYAWYVLSTLKEGEGVRTGGKEIIIDGNTGKVLEQNEWVRKE